MTYPWRKALRHRGLLLAVLLCVGGLALHSPSAMQAAAGSPQTVYVGSNDGTLFALDTLSGRKLWSFHTGGPITSRPLVVDATIYATSADGNIYALDFRAGDRLWNMATGGPISAAPVLVGDTLYVASSDNSIYALNANNGQRIWSFPTGGPVTGSPAVVQGTVYAGSADGSLYALDGPTGDLLWSVATDGPVHTTPAVVGGVVYAGSDDGSIYALSARNGQKLWSFATGGIVRSSPSVVGGIVYAGSADANIYAIDARTGQQIWSFPTSNALRSSPVVANGIAYVGSTDNTIYALNARTGARIWSVKTEGQIWSSAAVVGDNLYVGSVDQTLYALNARTGDQLWSFGTGSPVFSSPAVGKQATRLTARVVTPADPIPPVGADAHYFRQTGHNLAEPFLSFWQKNGGLATFGYPLTDAFMENGHPVQYTERFRLEEISGQIVTGPLGHILTLNRSFSVLAPFAGTASSIYFTSTGHSLSGSFLAYWHDHNGALLLGPPISQPDMETIDHASGRRVLVQWFERGRLDYAGNTIATPPGIQTGSLGADILAARGWTGSQQ